MVRGFLKLPDGNCGENGLVLMGRALLSKSLIQLSNFLLIDGAVFPPSCLIWDQTVVEIMKKMATSFKRSCACIATFSISDLAAGHCQSTPLLKLLDTHRQVWVSLLWGHCPFLLGLGAQGSVFPSKSLFPVLCKVWQLCVYLRSDQGHEVRKELREVSGPICPGSQCLWLFS